MAAVEQTHWWFVARRQIICDQIKRFNLSENAKILEVGSGTGGNLSLLSEFGKVSALEMDENAIKIANKTLKNTVDIRQGTCPDLQSFSGHTFDLICMFDVLEHIREDVETLDVLRSMLAPNGKLIITVPAYSWMFGAHDENLHHQRRYVRKGLIKKLRKLNYDLEKVSYFNTFLFPVIASIRFKERLFNSKVSVGENLPPSLLNSFLKKMFGSERFLLRFANLPFGVSLLAIASKKKI